MRRGRTGVALPLALFALVVIAALVGGAFASAYLEQLVGRNTLYGTQAAAAAEAGAVEVVGGWEAHALMRLLPGDSAVLAPVGLPGGSAYAPTVTRLNGELFLVRVEGRRTDAAGGTLARRTVEVVVRRADSVVPGLPPVWPLPGRGWTRMP